MICDNLSCAVSQKTLSNEKGPPESWECFQFEAIDRGKNKWIECLHLDASVALQGKLMHKEDIVQLQCCGTMDTIKCMHTIALKWGMSGVFCIPHTHTHTLNGNYKFYPTICFVPIGGCLL